MDQQRLSSSKQQHQFPTPSRFGIHAPFPGRNWRFEDSSAHYSPHPHHLQHHNVAISNSGYGYAADPSNLDEAGWNSTTSHSRDDAELSMGPFPERLDEPNCAFYMRTGHCGYGMNCRYNHPPNRNLAAALAKDKGEFPERLEQPECQYYLKTGTCKFGITCKFHHPKDRAGYVGYTALNALGFPLRLGEKDCAYYMRTGLCKYGESCKFNHPQPAPVRAIVAASNSSMYASRGSTAASLHPFQGIQSWSMPRAPYMPRSRFQAPSMFAPLIIQPQNMGSVPGWGAYQVRMGSQQPVLGGSGFAYGTGSINETPSGGVHTAYTPYVPGSSTAVLSPAMQSAFMLNDLSFPERPGQPDCQYYMKTGDCKYGSACRYNHPKDRASFIPNCVLNPLGFPIRQGAEKCAYYMQYGTCKYGLTCKFDHPTSNLAYSPSASSLMDLPLCPYPMALPMAVSFPANDTAVQGPILLHKRFGAAIADKEQGFKNPYPDGNAGETSASRSNNANLSSTSSNISSNAETTDTHGSAAKDATSSP